jgi:hypothetical protein
MKWRRGRAGVLAGLRRRARWRTDLPGGAVPQHDDFQLPVLALLLRVRHGVREPGPPPEVEGGREGGGLRGRGKEGKQAKEAGPPAPASPLPLEEPGESYSPGAILPTHSPPPPS